MNKKEYWISQNGLNELTSMVKFGMKIKDVCAKLGVGVSTLRKWRKEHPDLGDIFILKGHMEVEYISVELEDKREVIYQYYKNGKEVRYCRECKSFVDEKDIISSGYCGPCVKMRAKAYYRSKEGRATALAGRKRYYRENKIKSYKSVYKRHTLLKNSIFNYTEETWNETLGYFGNACAYCGRRDRPLEKEHVIPVSKNGAFVKANIVPSCKMCNRSKYIHNLEDWYPSYEYFTSSRYNKIKKWIGVKSNSQQLTLI